MKEEEWFAKLRATNCGAWIDVSTAEGRRRVCTLSAGHYDGPPAGTAPGMHAAKDRESWHTDCPAVAGQLSPLYEHDHEHPNMPHGSCMVWADSANGAHPSEVVTDPGCVRCGHAPDLHNGPDDCRAESCTCELSSVECMDEGWAQPVTEQAEQIIADAFTVKEPGRTLGTDIIGGYRADITIGDTGMSVYGPAKFVARVITAFADAFEEEAER
jgi:hypothetical protein